MNIITENQIVVIGPNNRDEAEIFLPLSGLSSKSKIFEFQDWVISEKGVSLGPSGADGKWGPETKAAWKQYGKEYNASKGKKTSLKKDTGKKEPSEKEKKDRAAKGQGWDKVKGAWVNIRDTAQQLGVFDALLAKIGLGPQPQGPAPVGSGPDLGPPPAAEKKGMSTTSLVLIGVGTVAVVAAIIYASRKK